MCCSNCNYNHHTVITVPDEPFLAYICTQAVHAENGLKGASGIDVICGARSMATTACRHFETVS